MQLAKNGVLLRHFKNQKWKPLTYLYLFFGLVYGCGLVINFIKANKMVLYKIEITKLDGNDLAETGKAEMHLNEYAFKEMFISETFTQPYSDAKDAKEEEKQSIKDVVFSKLLIE